MKSLLIQCLRGNDIGQINLNHINNKKIFYYVCKHQNDLSNDSEYMKNVLILEYQEKKSDRYCIGVASGVVESIKKLDDDDTLIIIKSINIHSVKNNNTTDFKDNSIKIYKNIKEYISEDKFKFEEQEKYKIELLDIDSLNLDNTKKCINEINEKNNKPNEEYETIMKSIDELEKVQPSAQRSRYVKRVIGKGDVRENRTEFQRDWERIIHSKSFRRLEDKAQIYTLSKGDHFRTRLTHTLEVTQIARGIARELKLNEDLVEAIALGHDLGHTPFGHVGERTLNEILQNENIEGGFKHNFQGVKVVNYLEEKYGEFEGIDLTYQVMEGILKHTKVCECKQKQKCTDKTEGLKCNNNILKIEYFLCNGEIEMLHPEFKFATTLEGQVVAVADEIAQRAHDLDDGIASGIINEDIFLTELKKMATEEFIERLAIEVASSVYKDGNWSKTKVEEQIEYNLEDIARNNILKNLSQKHQKEFLNLIKSDTRKIESEIIFDKDDFTKNVEKKLEDFNGEQTSSKEDKDDFKYELYNRISKSLDYIDEDQRDYIDTLDIKRARIVSDVITYFIAKIINDSEYRIKNYEKENLNDFKGDSLIINEELIKFNEKTEEVRVNLEKISSSRIINSEEVNCFDGKGKYVIRKIYNAYKTNPMQMSKTTLKRIYREVCKYTNYAVDITDFKCSRDKAEKEIAIYNGKDHSNDIKVIKHEVFVRCVVDLISGMTDDFANRQYDKLYSPRIY